MMKFRRITNIIVNGIVATAAELVRHPQGGCDVTDETAPRGFVTAADFSEFGLSAARWRNYWLRKASADGERPVRWERIPGKAAFDLEHPDAYQNALAGQRDWFVRQSPSPPPPTQTGPLFADAAP